MNRSVTEYRSLPLPRKPTTYRGTPRHDRQLGRPDRTPGYDPIRRSEDFLCNCAIEKGSNHRAAVRLFDASAGAGVKARELLNHLHVGHRVEFGPAKRARLQQARE